MNRAARLRPYFDDLHFGLRAVGGELLGQILLEIAELVDLGQQPDLDAELARVDLVALHHPRSFAYGDPHEGDPVVADAAVTPEVVGINLREASIPDNAGNIPVNTPVVENAPAAYFATLPVRDMVQAVKEKGIPCALSYTAGAFVCNDLLYTLLHHYRDTNVKVGFVHIPYLSEQAGERVPSKELSTVVEALTAMIGVMN